MRGTTREEFVGRFSLNKKELSGDSGLKSHLAQHLVQFRTFQKFTTKDSFSVSLLLLGEDKW